jgi:hypothetical protein
MSFRGFECSRSERRRGSGVPQKKRQHSRKPAGTFAQGAGCLGIGKPRRAPSLDGSRRDAPGPDADFQKEDSMRSSMIAILATIGAVAAAPAMAQTTVPAPATGPVVVGKTPPPRARMARGRGQPRHRMRQQHGTLARTRPKRRLGGRPVVREKDQVVMAVLSVGGFSASATARWRC